MFSAFDTVSADSSIIYVNDSGGNDDWDGQYAEWISGFSGPKKSIKNATGTVTEGGTVNIADGKYMGVNNTNITIDRNMTIKGQSRGGTIINGTNNAQIFVIQNGVNVTISNLTLAKGNATNGGAIYNNGTLNVINCNFTNNNAINGGTIWNNYGNCTIKDSIFSENTASYIGSGTITIGPNYGDYSQVDYGGAVFNYYGNLTVNNSTFSDNYASVGGAIYNYHGILNVIDSIITHNSAMGGIITNYNGTLNINGSNFINNYAQGAISNYIGILNVNGSNFTGNNVQDGTAAAILNYGYGGTSISTVENSTFNDNYSQSNAGAIMNDIGTFTVRNSTFINNHANDNGGAIYNYGTLNITNCTFIGNIATMGSVIYTRTGAQIHFNRITNNVGNYDICSEVAGVNAENNWWGTNFQGTNPQTEGRVSNNVDATPWIVLRLAASPTIINTSSTSTITADLRYNSDGVIPTGTLPLGMNITFTCDDLGSIIPLSKSIVNQVNATFTAGTVFGEARINATVDNQTQSTFIKIGRSNIYVATDGNDTTGTGSSEHPFQTLAKAITEVQADGTVHISSGIYSGMDNRGLTINKNMTILFDTWKGTEPVIINAGGIDRIFNIDSEINILIQNLTLINATADKGGAIYNEGNLTVKNINFIDNNATHGGAIYNYYGTIVVNNSNFTRNNAYNGVYAAQGGAIYNYHGTITVNNSNFTSNYAYEFGGAIYNDYGIMDINSSNFIRNNAVEDGGAINNYYGTLKVNNSIFTENSVTGGDVAGGFCGGAIINYGTLMISGSIFKGNNAHSGSGAIENRDGNATVNNCTFIGNKAMGAGAIGNDANLNVTSSTFEDNHALGNPYTYSGLGGAIGNGGNLIIHFSRFIKNTASTYHTMLPGTNIYNGGSLDAEYNWWGNNDGPGDSITNGYPLYDVYNPSRWLILNITNSPNLINNITTSTITVDLTHDNVGDYYDPALGHVPDGIPVNFATTLGSIDNQAFTVDGIAQATLNGGLVSGVADVTAIMDYQALDTFVSIDTIPPVVSIIDPANNVKINIINKIITITFSEPIKKGSTYDSISISGPSGPFSVTKSINRNILTLTPASNYANGNYILNIPLNAITDLADNNLEADFSSSFTVDTVPPTVTTSPIKGVSNSSINVSLSSESDAKIYYRINSGTWHTFTGSGNVLISNVGTNNLEFYAVDAAGNPSNPTIYSYTIDKTAPVVTATPTSGLSKSISVTLSSESNAKIYYRINSGSWHTFTGTGKLSITSSGTNKLEFYAVDVAGNPSAHKTYTYTIDKTAPVVTANQTSGLFNKDINVLLSSESDAKIYYSLNGGSWHTFTGSGTVSIIGEGINSLEVYAVDMAGNPSAHITYTYTIDKTAPGITVTPSNLSLSKESINVDISSESDATIYYKINSGSWNHFTGHGTVVISDDGITDLEVYAVDAAGNPSDHTVHSYVIDKTAPVVDANPANGLSNSTIGVNLLSESDATIYYKLNNGSWKTFTGSGKISISNVGTNKLEFYAVDRAGNPSAHKICSYTIDKTAPVVTATPTSGLSKSISVTLSSESNAKIYYRINGWSWHTFTGTGKVLISSAGTNKLEFYAVDRAGNPSAHKICSYTIDKTAPKVAATSPKNGAAGVSRTATISIRLSENILKSSNWSKIYIKNLKTGAKYKITAWVSGNHLYIKTNSKRAAYTWYQVYIPAAAIKDSAGNNLAATYAFKFKTGKY